MPSTYFDLRERCAYETTLLETVYAISDKRLFNDHDSLIFPPDGKEPEKLANIASGSTIIFDWRPKFLEVAKPLVLVAAFKVLDSFIEWTLDVRSHGYADKIKSIKKQGVAFDSLIEDWLEVRLIALYEKLTPLRGTIIHDQHFDLVNGALIVQASKKKLGPEVQFTDDDLRNLASVVVTLVRCVCRDWRFDDYQKKLMRVELDKLQATHHCTTLGQKRPWKTIARIYRLDGESIEIDIAAIRAIFAEKAANSDVVFDVRVIIVGSDPAVTRALRVPWEEFSDPSVKLYAVPKDKMVAFAAPVPDGIDLPSILQTLKTANS